MKHKLFEEFKEELAKLPTFYPECEECVTDYGEGYNGAPQMKEEEHIGWKPDPPGTHYDKKDIQWLVDQFDAKFNQEEAGGAHEQKRNN